MADLTAHVMINKWDDDINSAITSVGGSTYDAEGLPSYANIIKTQLVSNEAVGKGIYQDFLYTTETGGTSLYPWEGNPTTSTNAVQASVLANSIKQLFDAMIRTERFNILLVDKLPTTGINLSSIYLVKTSCCDECDCVTDTNMYKGCYFIKVGSEILRVDIPKFTINLENLFYVTREEYKKKFEEYTEKLEGMLKAKFGKYWDSELSLEENINASVDEVVTDFKTEVNEELDKKVNVADFNATSIDIEVINKLQ
jgi:hypothetical protein